MIMRLLYQDKQGFDRNIIEVGPMVSEVRATIPVVEALRKSGATVRPLPDPSQGYRIILGASMPKGIVAVHLNNSIHVGLRFEHEPEYPGEYPDAWQQVEWTPCPQCGAPVVWYEAGYVPGYRICSQPPHHHLLAWNKNSPPPESQE